MTAPGNGAEEVPGGPVADLSYTEASRELDEIVAFFEERDVDIDQLVSRLNGPRPSSTSSIAACGGPGCRWRTWSPDWLPPPIPTASTTGDTPEPFEPPGDEPPPPDDWFGTGDPGDDQAPGLF